MRAKQWVAVAAIAGAGYVAYRVLAQRAAGSVAVDPGYGAGAGGGAGSSPGLSFAALLDLLRGRSPRTDADGSPLGTNNGGTNMGNRTRNGSRGDHDRGSTAGRLELTTAQYQAMKAWPVSQLNKMIAGPDSRLREAFRRAWQKENGADYAAWMRQVNAWTAQQTRDTWGA